MKIDQLMHGDVKCCRPEDSLDTAAKMMWDFDIGALPVVDAASRVVGMITDRDICMAAYTQGRKLGELSVEGAMARKVIACHTGDAIESARGLMADNQIRRLPVIDVEGRLAAILTLDDLARGATEREVDDLSARDVAQTLAAITTPRAASAQLVRA